MRKIFLFFVVITIFSCASLNNKINIEKKNDNSYEIDFEPFYILTGNNEFNFKSELFYVYPDDFFYWNLEPENQKIKMEISKIKLLIEKDVIELQIFNLKEKKIILKKDSKNQTQKIEKKLIKLDYETYKKLTDTNLKTYIQISALINGKESEIKFLLESFDKQSFEKNDKSIEMFKEKLKKTKGK